MVTPFFWRGVTITNLPGLHCRGRVSGGGGRSGLAASEDDGIVDKRGGAKARPAAAHGEAKRGDPVVYIQLAHDGRHVVFHGLFGDKERLGDLAVGVAHQETVKHFQLARREIGAT